MNLLWNLLLDFRQISFAPLIFVANRLALLFGPRAFFFLELPAAEKLTQFCEKPQRELRQYQLENQPERRPEDSPH